MEPSYRNILVCAPNWLGDAVHSLPAVHTLRKGFPEAEITVLARAQCADVYRGCREIDACVSVPVSSLTGRFREYLRLRSRRFDLAILFPNSFESALMALTAAIPHRIGYRRDFRSLLLTRSIDSGDRHRLHRIDYYMRLLTLLGLEEGERIFPFHISGEEEKAAENLLAEQGISPDEPMAGIHFGAAFGTAKAWPPERYAELCDRLADRLRLRVAVFGGPGELPLLSRFLGSLRSKPAIWVGKTPLKVLAALIRRCGLFVSHDTGPLHLAYALGTPTVTLFGPTHPSVSEPQGEHHVSIYKAVECSPCWKRHCPIDHRCMMRITVEEVLAAAESLFKKASPRSK